MAALAMTSVLSATAENTTDTPTKKTRSEVFITEKGTEWEPAGEGVTRQIMGYDGQVMLVKVKFEKGAVGTPHTHYHTQTTYVASGKFEFTVGARRWWYLQATVSTWNRMYCIVASAWRLVCSSTVSHRCGPIS